MASMIQVFQLKHPNTGEPVSPVVNVGSIFDKKGQKVDNLLSYRIVGTDLTIPQFHDIQGDLDNRLTTIDNRLNNLDNEINNKITTKVNALNGIMDAATLGGSTKSQIISSARYTHPTTKQCNYSYVHPESQQCSNVNATKLGGKTLSEVLESVKSSSGSFLGMNKYVHTVTNDSIDISSYSLVLVVVSQFYSNQYSHGSVSVGGTTAGGTRVSVGAPSITSANGIGRNSAGVIVFNTDELSIAIGGNTNNELVSGFIEGGRFTTVSAGAGRGDQSATAYCYK